MITQISQVALLVNDYDQALDFYCGKLGFILLEDTKLPDKRWVRILPPGKQGSAILLSKAEGDQATAVGNQAGGRVLFFLNTNNFQEDYRKLVEAGVEFVEEPRHESYGSVAVLKDLYGNRIDLIQPKT